MLSEPTVVLSHFALLRRGLTLFSTLTDVTATKMSPNTDLVARLWSTIGSNSIQEPEQYIFIVSSWFMYMVQHVVWNS